jgi:hypothetical protein
VHLQLYGFETHIYSYHDKRESERDQNSQFLDS